MSRLRDISRQQYPSYFDRAFYERVQSAKAHYRMREKFVIPPFSGKAFLVNRGHTFRVIQSLGPQVGVIALWNAHNPTETYAPVRSRVFEGVFVSVFTRVWSEVPWLRPLMVCVEDTLATRSTQGDFHHHRFWTHCTAETMEMRSGRTGLNSCRANLLAAIRPFGLGDEHFYGNINTFQKVQVDPRDGKFYGSRSDSQPGDYIEFYAELDLIVAVSVCPFADNTRAWSTPEENVVLPLGVEVYDTGIQPNESPVWTDWRLAWNGRWEPSTDQPGG